MQPASKTKRMLVTFMLLFSTGYRDGDRTERVPTWRMRRGGTHQYNTLAFPHRNSSSRPTAERPEICKHTHASVDLASDRVTHGGTEAAVNLQIKGQRLHENRISARGLARFSIRHLRFDLRMSFHFNLLHTPNLPLKSHFLFPSGHDGQVVIKTGNLAQSLQSCEYF